ncbi:MAG: DedA family protein [Patescibacteria group bacterium]|nr:DedA family protein [Patescibacteria group bacterium]
MNLFTNLPLLVESVGILGVAAMIFAESGLFFGFFFPGDSLLFTAGFLASQGTFGIQALVFLAIIAAIAGDSAGYWFGRKIGPRIFTRPDSFWFSHQRVEDAHRFFEQNGAKSIFLARFIPAVRTFTPIIAGVAGMRYQAFLSWNIVGGIVWAAGIPLAGYFLGAAIPGVDRYLLPIVGLIIVLSVIPIAREWLRRRA